MSAVPGIKAIRDVPLVYVLSAAALTPFCFVLWLITVPFVMAHFLGATILSFVTQRNWYALMRSMVEGS